MKGRDRRDGKWDGANKSVIQSFKNSFEAYTFLLKYTARLYTFPFTSTAK